MHPRALTLILAGTLVCAAILGLSVWLSRETSRSLSSLAASPITKKTPVPPEELFIKLGCPTCHAKGAPHEDKLAASVGKPVGEVADWIRDPQRKKPGTIMPSFGSRLDEAEALALAAWVQRMAAAD